MIGIDYNNASALARYSKDGVKNQRAETPDPSVQLKAINVLAMIALARTIIIVATIILIVVLILKSRKK